MDIRHDASVHEPATTPHGQTPHGPWPEDSLARVPYWVYQDPDNYTREQRRIFEGATDMYAYIAGTPLGKESPEQARKAGRSGQDVARELAERK